MNNEENAASRKTISDPVLPTKLDHPPESRGEFNILSKADRVALINAEMAAAPPLENREQALRLFDQVFRKIEDTHSGVFEDPDCRIRLCPPVAEQEQVVEGKPWLRRYVHTRHYTLIAENGAIEIRTKVRNEANINVEGPIAFEKRGADGRSISEMK